MGGPEVDVENVDEERKSHASALTEKDETMQNYQIFKRYS
jgi:hypothetical protein